jgi:hypothetical protein
LPSPNPKHHRTAIDRRPERGSGDALAQGDLELIAPSAGAVHRTLTPSPSDVMGHHDVSRDQTAPRRNQAPEHRHRYRKWGVGDDPECAPRKSQVRRIRHDDSNLAGEATAQLLNPVRVQLNCHHPRPDPKEGHRDDAVTRADIENEISGDHSGRGDNALRPPLIEPVPSPVPCRGGAHGASSW